jgi:hemoglobin/transferrin/lactoferrin receptor protein
MRRKLGVILFALVSPVSIMAQSALSGSVRDLNHAVVREAALQLADPNQAVVATTVTNAEGAFRFPRVPAGDYVLVVTRAGSTARRLPVRIGSGATELEIILDQQPVRDAITVTASSGAVELALEAPQAVSLIDRRAIDARAKTVVAQIVNEETGAALQRTGPSMSGIFVRGLTGNKVNIFIDGVRYSNGAQRGGVNTFLNLIDPSSIDSVEILRGPSSAQYGSDALGGSVQFRSPLPVFSGAGAWHGNVATSFNSADVGCSSSASASYSKGRFGMLVGLTGRRANTLRPGGGIDSRSAVTRFFGLPSTIAYGPRLPDSAFTQYGGNVRLHYTLGSDAQVIAHYQRFQQDGGKRLDQLMGGDGNLIADLRNLMLDFGYLRYDKAGLGWFDNFSATYSYNAQREERVNQGGNGNPRSTITHEPERTRVHGLQTSAAKRLNSRWNTYVGGDYYRERIAAPSYGLNPVTLVASVRRGRVPDNSLYQNGGAYLQSVFDVAPGRFRLTGNIRYSAAAYESLASDSPLVGGKPLWPNDSMRVDNATFRAGAVVTPVSGFNLVANLSRGFRAPHVTDLGTLGLTGSGFEVAAPDVAGLGAMVGSTAGADAVSIGRPVEQIKPETSMNYEGGVRYRNDRVSGEVMVFLNDIYDNIVKQSLILPQGAVGTLLGSEPVVSQNANGVVYVGASSSPVLIRTNYDDARIIGVEARFEAKAARSITLGGVFTSLRARDKRSGLAPNIEGGTPPLNGYLRLRYTPSRGNFWIEPYLYAANSQDRLSSLDLSDRRTGSGRSKSNIANFFNNGATVRGLVQNGILVATGETLAQVQARVLGPSLASSSLYPKLNGYVTLNVRAGYALGENHDLILEAENIADRNYRSISWGLDAPGRSVYLRYAYRF